MLYTSLLFLHSWLRWAVVLAGVHTLVRSTVLWRKRLPWTGADRGLQRLFVVFVDLQLVVGLALYLGVSPIIPHSLAGLRAAMKVDFQRFYAVEHAFGMLVAVALIHVAAVRSRKMADPVLKHRRWVTGLVVAFAVMMALIPWPVASYGRPLFRIFQ